jgi:hypothetical protein
MKVKLFAEYKGGEREGERLGLLDHVGVWKGGGGGET